MRQGITWQASDKLLRGQLALFDALGRDIGLATKDRQQALQLDAAAWAAWTDLLGGGPLPARPSVPEMLQRLGHASHHLAVQVEKRGLPSVRSQDLAA